VTSAGASWSNLQDPFEAGQEAASLALNRLDEDTCDLVLVFSAPRYATAELLEGVRAVTGSAPLLGCTDAGNLTADGPAHASVAVMAVRCEGLEVRPGAGDKLAADPEAAGEAMARQAREGRLGSGSGPGSLLLAVSDGSRGNHSAVLRGAQRVVGDRFPVIGVSAGDDGAFTETAQYCLTYLLKDSVAGLLIGGPIRFGVGTRHGWGPISRERRVTGAHGAVVTRIDDGPALALYRDYLGEAADDLSNDDFARTTCVYPLGFSADGEPEPLVRFPMRVTQEGGLVFGGEVAEGTGVRLMLATKDSVIASARGAAQEALDALGGAKAKAAVVFSCFAREKVMGREAAREMRAVREVLGEIPMVGCYCYGQTAPFQAAAPADAEGPPSRYRNDSIVVLALGDG